MRWLVLCRQHLLEGRYIRKPLAPTLWTISYGFGVHRKKPALCARHMVVATDCNVLYRATQPVRYDLSRLANTRDRILLLFLKRKKHTRCYINCVVDSIVETVMGGLKHQLGWMHNVTVTNCTLRKPQMTRNGWYSGRNEGWKKLKINWLIVSFDLSMGYGEISTLQRYNLDFAGTDYCHCMKSSAEEVLARLTSTWRVYVFIMFSNHSNLCNLWPLILISHRAWASDVVCELIQIQRLISSLLESWCDDVFSVVKLRCNATNNDNEPVHKGKLITKF